MTQIRLSLLGLTFAADFVTINCKSSRDEDRTVDTWNDLYVNRPPPSPPLLLLLLLLAHILLPLLLLLPGKDWKGATAAGREKEENRTHDRRLGEITAPALEAGSIEFEIFRETADRDCDKSRSPPPHYLCSWCTAGSAACWSVEAKVVFLLERTFYLLLIGIILHTIWTSKKEIFRRWRSHFSFEISI